MNRRGPRRCGRPAALPGGGGGGWGPRGAGPPPLTLELALRRPPPSHCPRERQPWGRTAEWACHPPSGTRTQAPLSPESRLIGTQGKVGLREGSWRGTLTSLPGEPLPTQPAVFLQFEDLGAPTEWPHRRVCPLPSRAVSGQGAFQFSFRMYVCMCGASTGVDLALLL